MDNTDYFNKARFDELVIKSFMLVKNNLNNLIKLTLLPISISFVSQYGLGLSLEKPEQFIICAILYALSHYFAYTLMIYAISHIILKKDWSPQSIYKQVLSNPLGEISGSIGLFLVIFLIGIFLFVVPSIASGIFFAFFLPFSILKKVYYKEALLSSYKLVSGQWLRIFGYYSFSTLLFGLSFLGITVITSSLTKLVIPGGIQELLFTVLLFFLTSVFSMMEHSFHIFLFFCLRKEREDYNREKLENELFPVIKDKWHKVEV